MGDILDQADAELDLYGEGGEELDSSQFTEQDVLGDDDEAPPGTTIEPVATNNGVALKQEQNHNGDDHDVHVKNELHDESDDLYDEAIEPSAGDLHHRNTRSSIGSHDDSQHSMGSANTSMLMADRNQPGRRFFCYIGNMTWWTTDADLQSAIASCNVGDLVDLKFYENRANGQSKGFALAVFAAESAVRTVMEKLPTKQIHGQQLVVLPYTKSSLAKFEEATRRTDKPDLGKKDEKSGFVNVGTIRIGGPPGPPVQQPPQPMGINPGHHMMGQMRPGMGIPQQVINAVRPPQHAQMNMVHQLMMGGGMHHQPNPVSLTSLNLGRPPMVMNAPPPMAGMSRPPPTFGGQGGGMHPGAAALMAGGGRLPIPGAPGGFPPPGAHINPQVYPGLMQGRMDGGGVVSEQEFDEVMNRNRTVSSSAISRAVSDAATGDFQSAVETLVTAISLIRQSRVANDDRCKVLINSLQDTLHGIEAKGYASGGSRKHRGGASSGRDRSRSPDRGSRKRHRRSSRSRSRSRDRYDYSPRHSSSARRY